MVALHELKTWPKYFEAVARGVKTFEIRKDDRGFGVGDILCLREWTPGSERYTGRTHYVCVSFVLKGGQFGLEPGHAALALGPVPWERFDAVMIHRRDLRPPTSDSSPA